MKIIYTFLILVTIVFSSVGQNILFSFEIDATDPSMVEAKIFARSSGASENLSGYTAVFYYNSADVDWLSYDQIPAQTLGWITNDFTAREDNPASNAGVPIAHDSRLELQQFDGNFSGSTISSTPVHVGTLIFTAATSGLNGRGFLAPGDVFLSDESIDPGIQYVNSAFTGTNIATEGSTSQSILPVDFNFFKARKNDETSSLLSWETATEINNDYFNVERSADGRIFETIGKVNGNGTTNLIQEYSFIDRNPHSGRNYYRLKQVDYNGAFEYSNVEVVDFSRTGTITVFPNPTADIVNINFDKQYKSGDIVNQAGQRVRVINTQSDNARINVSDLPAGVYNIELYDGIELKTEQFIKVR